MIEGAEGTVEIVTGSDHVVHPFEPHAAAEDTAATRSRGKRRERRGELMCGKEIMHTLVMSSVSLILGGEVIGPSVFNWTEGSAREAARASALTAARCFAVDLSGGHGPPEERDGERSMSDPTLENVDLFPRQMSEEDRV